MPRKTITNPQSIPAKHRGVLKEVCEKIGPQFMGDDFPKDEEGNDKTDLSPEEAAEVIEFVTRRFWADQIRAHKVEQARTVAADQARAEVGDDPFAEE